MKGVLASLVVGVGLLLLALVSWMAWQISRIGLVEIPLQEEHATEGTFLLRQEHSEFLGWSRRLMWNNGGDSWVVYYMGHEEDVFEAPSFKLEKGVLEVLERGETIGKLQLGSGDFKYQSRCYAGPLAISMRASPLDLSDRVQSGAEGWAESYIPFGFTSSGD